MDNNLEEFNIENNAPTGQEEEDFIQYLIKFFQKMIYI